MHTAEDYWRGTELHRYYLKGKMFGRLIGPARGTCVSERHYPIRIPHSEHGSPSAIFTCRHWPAAWSLEEDTRVSLHNKQVQGLSVPRRKNSGCYGMTSVSTRFIGKRVQLLVSEEDLGKSGRVCKKPRPDEVVLELGNQDKERPTRITDRSHKLSESRYVFVVEPRNEATECRLSYAILRENYPIEVEKELCRCLVRLWEKPSGENVDAHCRNV